MRRYAGAVGARFTTTTLAVLGAVLALVVASGAPLAAQDPPEGATVPWAAFGPGGHVQVDAAGPTVRLSWSYTGGGHAGFFVERGSRFRGRLTYARIAVLPSGARSFTDTVHKGRFSYRVQPFAPGGATLAPSDPVVVDVHAVQRGPDGEELMYDEEPPLPPDALGVNAAAAAAACPTGDYRIDALLSGYRWPLTTVTYSFYSDAVFGGSYYGSETVSEVSEKVKTNVRKIMAWYSTIMNVDYVEVAETPSTIGLIRFMLSSGPSYAYAYYPSSTAMFSLAGDVHLNPAYEYEGETNGWENDPGKHGYMSLVHEIGHTLGLKHPFEGTCTLPTGEDNTSHTVMTYTFTGNSSGTPMPYDLLALQYIYGARPHNPDGDVYAFTSRIDQFTVNGQTLLDPSTSTKQTIWDTGGVNTLDFSNLAYDSGGHLLDLNEGGWLIKKSANQTTYFTYGTAVGFHVAIARVVSSGSNDDIVGNPGANVFTGYTPARATGNDTLLGAEPQDTVDLSAYTPSQVGQTQDGNDLVLTLDGHGTIRIKDYYLGNTPEITFLPVVPAAAINDVSLQEGNSGTSAAVFTVTLSEPSSESIVVDWATADGSALAGSDYLAGSGSVTFDPGQTSETITVQVLGDTSEEPDETFTVDLTGVTSNARIGDGQGTGTIRNDDLPPNDPPSAVANANPQSGYAPLTVGFDGSASTDDGTIVSYAWRFGDGGSGSGVTVSHEYVSPGTYTVTLTVTDDRGATDSDSVAIEVTQDPAKVIRVGAIDMALVAVPGGTSASASVLITDLGGGPVAGATVSGAWSGLASGSDGGTTGADGRATFTSRKTKKSGTFTFTVVAVAKTSYQYDPAQNVETSDSISTDAPVNKNPVAVIDASPTSGAAPLAVSFSGANSYDPDGTIASYAWSFGDGGTASGTTASHTYTADGTYTATLTVTDDKGATGSAQKTITVGSTPPAGVVYVAAIAMSAQSVSGGVAGQAVVTIVDGNGLPVPGATVTGTWTGAVTGSSSGSTGADGTVALTSRKTKKSGTATFTVTAVSASGLTYDPSLNVVTSADVNL